MSLPPQHIYAHAWAHPPGSHTSLILCDGETDGEACSLRRGREGGAREPVLTGASHNNREHNLPVVLTTRQRYEDSIKRWRWKSGSDISAMTTDSHVGSLFSNMAKCQYLYQSVESVFDKTGAKRCCTPCNCWYRHSPLIVYHILQNQILMCVFTHKYLFFFTFQ